MNFPFLTIITFTPIVAGVIILLTPKERKLEIKSIAAIAAFVSMVLSLYAFATYFSVQAADPAQAQYQFQEAYQWVPSLGITYHVGGDGINLTMLILTGIVSFMGVLISWGINERPREFFSFFMFLVAGVYGVFVSLDLFLLLFFYELSIFPMYFLIANWGSTRKEYAAMKLTLYLLIGSIIALVGLLAVYFSAQFPEGILPAGQTHTFDMLLLQQANIPIDVQRFWFLPIFIGFGVLAGIWPFHNWSPDGHVAAPTAVSMIHAGVLMKLGAYAALVTAVKLLPQAAREQLPYVILLVTVNVVYGAAIAMVQKDFKYVIGFSSVSHMGLVTMGFATLNQVGLNGAVMQMFSHGVMTALFFCVVGTIYDRAHTRQIPELGGFAKFFPIVAIAFIIGGLASMGMPGLSGFVAELQIFMGLWQANAIAPWYIFVAIISILGVVLTAAYVLRVVQQVFFGDWDPHKWHDLRPINAGDKLALVTFSAILIVVGVFPGVLMNMISSGTLPVAK
ncbi:MAG TPA: NADH-quinone oxidoreductase subunit M, partial [Anaerolineae bacterium]